MHRRVAISSILIVLLLSACGKSASPSETLRDRHLAALKKIADQCGLPASTFRLIGEDQLSFRPGADANYGSVDCALRKLQNSDLRFKIGFVGNQAVAPEKNDVPAR